MGKYKIFLIIILLIFGIPFVIAPRFLNVQKTSKVDKTNYFLSKQLGGVLLTLAQNLVDPIILDEKPTLGKIVAELRKVEGIEYASICGSDGKIISSIKPQEEGKPLKNIIGIDVNLGKFPQINYKEDFGLYYIRTPIKFEAAGKEKVVGNLVVGVSANLIKDLFSPATTASFNLFPYVGLLIGLIIFAFILAQVLIFAPVGKKLEALESRQKRYLTYESLKKAEKEAKENVSKLEDKKRELQEEIEKLNAEIQEKRKKVEETDIGKIVKELEQRKTQLEEEIERLKKEEEEVRQKLLSQKMEQEELKKRLDIIRKKMKQIMG